MASSVALVTGAASGMGKVFTQRMAAQGISVAALDRNAEALSVLAMESDLIAAYPCDVTDRQAVVDSIAQITENLGPIDRLVHCAAIMPAGKLAQHPTASLRQVMEVNYGGTVNVVAAVLPAMLERDAGEIALFGSVGGQVPIPECGGYCASKAAVNSYAEILIEENRDSQVHILLACPSLVNTPLLEQAAKTGNPAMVDYSIRHRRYSDPADIVRAVEQALLHKKDVIYPTLEARMLAWLRRFSPRLVWKILNASNRPQGTGP